MNDRGMTERVETAVLVQSVDDDRPADGVRVSLLLSKWPIVESGNCGKASGDPVRDPPCREKLLTVATIDELRGFLETESRNSVFAVNTSRSVVELSLSWSSVFVVARYVCSAVEGSSFHEAGPGKTGRETSGFSLFSVVGDGGVPATEGAHAIAIVPRTQMEIVRALFHIPYSITSDEK
jgi:hypothetical protein